MAYDVIVIGAGLSGLLGGIRLAEAGRRVLLLAKGHGTTHWSNGTIGIARGAAPLTGFARLAADTEHPYARVDLAILTAVTECLRALCAAGGLSLRRGRSTATPSSPRRSAQPSPPRSTPRRWRRGRWSPVRMRGRP